MIKSGIFAAACAVVALAAPAAQAKTVSYFAKLDGAQEVPAFEATNAFGNAKLVVFKKQEKIKFKMRVRKIDVGDLVDVSGLGPVHLHNGFSGANGPVSVPFTFADSKYSDTKRGFKLKVGKVSFSDIATASSGNFDDFLQELKAGNFYVNVHTAAGESGEIRGQLKAKKKSGGRGDTGTDEDTSVTPVPLPAAGLLLVGGLAVMGGLRRRRKA